MLHKLAESRSSSQKQKKVGGTGGTRSETESFRLPHGIRNLHILKRMLTTKQAYAGSLDNDIL